MTWETVTFATGSGRPRPVDIRIGVVQQNGKLLSLVVIPGEMAKEIRWKAGMPVGISRGAGEHAGMIRLVPLAVAFSRALRGTGKSKNLRFVSPIWPWLAKTITETRSLEVVPHTIGPNIIKDGPACLDLHLPAWAKGEECAAAMVRQMQRDAGATLPITLGLRGAISR